jgi:hypothetical protein
LLRHNSHPRNRPAAALPGAALPVPVALEVRVVLAAAAAALLP